MPILNENVEFIFVDPTSSESIDYSYSSFRNTIFFNARDNEIYVGGNKIIGQPTILFWNGIDQYLSNENYSFNNLLQDFTNNKKINFEIQKENSYILKSNNFTYDETNSCFYVGPIYDPEDQKICIYKLHTIGAGTSVSVTKIQELAMT